MTLDIKLLFALVWWQRVSRWLKWMEGHHGTHWLTFIFLASLNSNAGTALYVPVAMVYPVIRAQLTTAFFFFFFTLKCVKTDYLRQNQRQQKLLGFGSLCS